MKRGAGLGSGGEKKKRQKKTEWTTTGLPLSNDWFNVVAQEFHFNSHIIYSL